MKEAAQLHQLIQVDRVLILHSLMNLFEWRKETVRPELNYHGFMKLTKQGRSKIWHIIFYLFAGSI